MNIRLICSLCNIEIYMTSQMFFLSSEGISLCKLLADDEKKGLQKNWVVMMEKIRWFWRLKSFDWKEITLRSTKDHELRKYCISRELFVVVRITEMCSKTKEFNVRESRDIFEIKFLHCSYRIKVLLWWVMYLHISILSTLQWLIMSEIRN